MAKKAPAGEVLMGEKEIARALGRIAQDILEHAQDPTRLALVGIRRGGVPLAQRLRELVKKKRGVEVPIGQADITLYRDDVAEGLQKPLLGPTDIPFDVRGKLIVLVDDVLYTGRTVRAALDVLIEFGRPRTVELAVLVDRGCRELPIQADYVGLKVSTTHNQTVDVELRELGGMERVVLREKR